MAKLSDLVATTARTLNLKEPTVREIARQVRRAGYIQTGGRGPGSPDMTTRDAAALLMAIIGGSDVIDSPRTVKLFDSAAFLYYTNRLPPTRTKMAVKDGEFLGLPMVHTFGQAVEALIESYRTGTGPRAGKRKLPLWGQLVTWRPVTGAALAFRDTNGKDFLIAAYSDPRLDSAKTEAEALAWERESDLDPLIMIERSISLHQVADIARCLGADGAHG